MKISHIYSRQIIDSRGNPTVEADVVLENGVLGRASVPSGASTGTNEAIELRDGDASKFNGKGVLKAVNNIKQEIEKALVGKEASDQKAIDETLISLDGTENKSRLGANAILAVSLATAKAEAQARNVPLFEYIHAISNTKKEIMLPTPMVNIINGGKHAAGSTDIQEFMIIPAGAKNFSEAIRMCAEIFHALGKVISSKGYQTTVGDEGGYAPQVKQGNKEALELISAAVEKAGYNMGHDVFLALDVASSELYENNAYQLKTENKILSNEELIAWYQELSKTYPIISIEDGLAEHDWEGWKKITNAMGANTQLVGDDLLVTNTKFLKQAIDEKAGNSILIKVNQIGTLTETLNAVAMADSNGWNSIISHRSGETEDTTIAHLVCGLATGQIKTGSLSRTDRTAKYNELLRIEEMLGAKALFAGMNPFKK